MNQDTGVFEEQNSPLPTMYVKQGNSTHNVTNLQTASLVFIFSRRWTTRLQHTLQVRVQHSDQRRVARLLTSVISNLTLPMDSPSAMARYEVNVGWPTMEARVSRCWCVSQSLRRGRSSINKENQYTYYLVKSAWPVMYFIVSFLSYIWFRWAHLCQYNEHGLEKHADQHFGLVIHYRLTVLELGVCSVPQL